MIVATLNRLLRRKPDPKLLHERAMARLKAGWTLQAFQQLQASAEAGLAAAQHDLARHYELAMGVVQNLPDALTWYHRAADQGHRAARSRLGLIYLMGPPTEAAPGVVESPGLLGGLATRDHVLKQDHELAAHWNQLAAEADDAEAQARYGHQLAAGLGVAQDLAGAELWLQRAARQDDVGGMTALGAFYAGAYGGTADVARALPWLQRACELGSVDAKYWLGVMTQGASASYQAAQVSAQAAVREAGTDKVLAAAADLEIAADATAKWLESAALQGHVAAMYQLGLSHWSGRGATKDLGLAETWLRRAAARNLPDAMRALAQLKLEQDDDDGIDAAGLLWQAAEAGDARSAGLLGELYLQGRGVPRDPVEAARWLTVAGKQARPQALTALAGLQLHVGRGAGAYASAAEWLALASYDGDMAAMHTLGRLYQHGRGVEQDLYRAADWYRLAAESGCAQSAFALGLLMAEEGGPVQDDVAALGWLRTAAQRWHALAPCNLALMAYAGRGQPSNPAEALAILETAVCRGNVHATVMLAEWCTDGVHMQPSPQRARNLLSQAVTMGSVKAACLLVNLLDCTAQPGDAAQVRRVLARACATPPLPANLEASLVARAHDALARWLTRQTPGRPVDDELLMHRECAAEGGVADAQAWMADHLHQRSLAEPDQLDLPQRALYWYGQASRQGHVGALLAWHIWVDGASPGVPEKTDAGSPSDGRFFGLWVAAAGQGHVRAQLQLASMYVAGLGCPVDVAAARRWLQRAADQGDSMAQGRLRELGQA